jgi:GDP-L-fucose synthase
VKKNSKIYVAGHTGLVGSAILRQLQKQEYSNIVTVTRAQLNLFDQSAVDLWFEQQRPEYVFLAAAQVFGIASTISGEVILNNLRIQTNVIDAARRNGCKKLLFLGSNCAYPKFPRLPITEDQLLSGPLEPTSESYAVAKIAGIMMCKHFRKQWNFPGISVMLCNLYGPNDKYDLEQAHVMASMINKFVTAQRNNLPYVTLWGDGTARREFLHVDDAAKGIIFCMENYDHSEPINVASGNEISLRQLADMISQEVGYTGKIVWDINKPSGTPSKSLDIEKITELGWQSSISLQQGIAETVAWYKGNYQ